jgi:hypothetical protein
VLSNDSCFRSTSFATVTAVNILLTEESMNGVSGVFRRPAFRSAKPYPLLTSG